MSLNKGHHYNGDRAARRPHLLFSIRFHSFGAVAKAVRLFIASLHSQPMYPKMRSIDFFDNLQPVGINLKILNSNNWNKHDQMINMLNAREVQMYRVHSGSHFPINCEPIVFEHLHQRRNLKRTCL